MHKSFGNATTLAAKVTAKAKAKAAPTAPASSSTDAAGTTTPAVADPLAIHDDDSDNSGGESEKEDIFVMSTLEHLVEKVEGINAAYGFSEEFEQLKAAEKAPRPDADSTSTSRGSYTKSTDFVMVEKVLGHDRYMLLNL